MYSLFSKCLIEFACEAIWSWTLVHWKFFFFLISIYVFIYFGYRKDRFYICVYLINNIVLISSVQKVIQLYIHVYPFFFKFFDSLEVFKP